MIDTQIPEAIKDQARFKGNYILDSRAGVMYYWVMKQLLQNITVGMTTTVNGHVVTRWSEISFEVDMWGKVTVDLESALSLVAR